MLIREINNRILYIFCSNEIQADYYGGYFYTPWHGGRRGYGRRGYGRKGYGRRRYRLHKKIGRRGRGGDSGSDSGSDSDSD